MQARVLQITADQLYLEIDKQVRFTTHFCLDCQQERLDRNDLVDFVFADQPGIRQVIIQRVTHSHRTPL